MEHKFDLGDVLKDLITGFQGVAMARTDYFTDCTHYGLQGQELKDGKPTDWQWFDETRLRNVYETFQGETIKERVVLGPRSKPTSGPFQEPAPFPKGNRYAPQM